MKVLKYDEGTSEWYYEAKERLEYISELLKSSHISDDERDELYMEQCELISDLDYYFPNGL